MRLILTAEHMPSIQGVVCRNGQLCSGTDYFGCPCFLLFLYWLLMVTIERLLPYSYWIGHPVTCRALIYLFVGFVPLTNRAVHTLKYILILNNRKWAPKYQQKNLDRTRQRM